MGDACIYHCRHRVRASTKRLQRRRIVSKTHFITNDLLTYDRVILDSRTSYEMERGYVIKCEFATEDMAEPWPKLELPRTKAIEDKVAAMQSSKIRVNVIFQQTTRTAAEH